MYKAQCVRLSKSAKAPCMCYKDYGDYRFIERGFLLNNAKRMHPFLPKAEAASNPLYQVGVDVQEQSVIYQFSIELVDIFVVLKHVETHIGIKD